MTRWVAISTLTVFFGCAHQQPKKEEPQQEKSTRPTKQSSAVARNEGADTGASNKDCGVVRVHFQLDSSEIDPRDKDALEKSADCLKSNKALHVTIEGNADERGTEEYNLALGDKRANAVSRYLRATCRRSAPRRASCRPSATARTTPSAPSTTRPVGPRTAAPRSSPRTS
jgi:peptidoglycan-associated lipoprotein